ncbi:MAG: T9SS type A sorting domain-containing protein [Flavobacteriales bacterium]|nr:T9SS type A sorting domain-containing protein [Flavobacteriales bacterium]
MRSLLLIPILAQLSAVATPLGVVLDPESREFTSCSNPIGELLITASGGTEPYTYQWSDGPTSEDRTNLSAGSYTVTVTDFVGGTVDATFTILNDAQLYGGFTQAGGMPCPGEANGTLAITESTMHGLPPYSHSVTANGLPLAFVGLTTPWNDPMYYGFANGDLIEVEMMDALGCTGSITQVAFGPDATPIGIDAIMGECIGTLGSVQWSASFPWMIDLTVVDDAGVPHYQTSTASTAGTIIGLPAGDYVLKQTWTYIWTPPCDTLFIPFTVPDIGNLCGTVQGSSWYDLNGDCVRDANEVGIPYSPMLIEPGGQVALTNYGGGFNFPLTNGAYTLEQSDATLIPICPAVQPVPFTVNSNIQTISLANGSTVPLDLSIAGSHAQARPGFTTQIDALVRNLSPQLSGAVTATITFDPLLVFQSAWPTPTSVIGSTVTWDFPAMNSFAQQDMHVQANVPVGTALGTMLACSGTVSNTLSDAVLSNNSFGVSQSVTQVVTGSIDPNDKVARTSSGWSDALYYIDQDEWIDYTIRFQNTGTDTAFTVVVTDTVSGELDLLSFEQGASSHPFAVSFKPGRVIEWRFANILLPDSNVDEAASHGLVSFRIKPVLPLLLGTSIENTANIYFDFNDPVITEPSVLTAEFSTGIRDNAPPKLMLAPNPANERIQLTSDVLINSVRIIAVDGRILAERSVRSTISYIDTSGLPNGLYTVRTTLESGGSQRVPFIVLHD